MIYDTVIIGGGVAGLTAGLYAMRAGLKTLLFEKMYPGGQCATIAIIENYPGFPEPLSGPELAMKIHEQVENFGLETRYEEIKDIMPVGEIKQVITEEDEIIETKTIIVCSGAMPRPLGLKKEILFRGRGVSYCGTCDAALYKDKTVIVVGGGDTAVEDALFISQFAEKVYVVHRRDELRANIAAQKKAFANEKIEFKWNCTVTEILGDDTLTGVVCKNSITGEETSLYADGMFIAIGIIPSNELLKGKVNLTDNGFVLTDETMMTNEPGLFAAGDLREKPLLQLVTAAADGATALVSAHRYIIEFCK